MNPLTTAPMENDMNVELSSEVIDRARGVVQQMKQGGTHAQSFSFFEGDSSAGGVVSDAKENILILSSFEFDGSTYYIGLPLS